MPHLVLYRPEQMPRPFHQKILVEMERQWPQGFCGDLCHRDWIHPVDAQPKHLLLLRGDELMGFCSLMHRDFNDEIGPIRANGLSGVLIFPEYRQQGWGKVLLQGALDALGQEACDISFLSCQDDLIPFYQSLAWKNAPCAAVIKGDPQNLEVDQETLLCYPWSIRGGGFMQSLTQRYFYFGKYTW